MFIFINTAADVHSTISASTIDSTGA